jgi:hypothetical protein
MVSVGLTFAKPTTLMLMTVGVSITSKTGVLCFEHRTRILHAATR